MRIVRTILVILSALLIAAHLMRAGVGIVAMLALGLPFLLISGQPWMRRTLQVLLLLASVEWIRTAILLAQARHMTGEPWTRMAVILGSVAAVTLLSALLVRPVPTPKVDRTM